MISRAHRGNKRTLRVLRRTRRASGDTAADLFHTAEQRLSRGSGRQLTILFSGFAPPEHAGRHNFAGVCCLEMMAAKDTGQPRVDVPREGDTLVQHGYVARMHIPKVFGNV